MPRPRLSQKVIDQTRNRILDAALKIIYMEGFASLSMRKIASRIGMSAPNIYRYYKNKDEIYLSIQKRGFEVLGARFREIEKKEDEPVNRIRAMIKTYIDFGITYPDQYEIMFTRNTPKYADYIGTSLEPAAEEEKQTALLVAEAAARTISEAYSKLPPEKRENPGFRTLQLWTALHGAVSLINSRVLQEVDPDTDRFIERMVNDLIQPFVPDAPDCARGKEASSALWDKNDH